MTSRTGSTPVVVKIATAFLGTALAFSTLLAPAQAAEDRSLTYDMTIDNVGRTSAEITYTPSGDRVLAVEDKGTETPGGYTWVDAATNKVNENSIPLAQAEPQYIVADEARDRLYVLHYRTQVLNVLQLSTNTLLSTIEGMPRFPYGMVLNSDTGNLYVWDSSVLEINPATGVVKPAVSVSNEKYPLLKDAVYDSENKLLWIAEGRKKIITAINTETGRWKQDIAIPVSDFSYNGEAVQGRASVLALDPVLHSLYAAVTTTTKDTWTGTKLVTINTSTHKHVGEPIMLGDTVRDLVVNPSTHEVVAAAGFANKVHLVDPSTWTVSSEIDFNQVGITQGTGAGAANVWGLALNGDGTKVYVSHPYTDQISVLRFTGTPSAATARAEAPGQGDDPTTPEPTTPSSWEGPSATAPAQPSDSATPLTAGNLTWGVSEYAQGWEQIALGSHVATDESAHTFTFSNGTGWYDTTAHTAILSWQGGFSLRPYADLVPSIRFLMGNPTLTIAADGTGTLTMDVSTIDDKGTQSEYKNLTVATFDAGALSVDQRDGKVAIAGTPAFTNDSWPREFVDFIPAAMQAWWYKTGATMDSQKAPAPINVTAAYDPKAQPSEEASESASPEAPTPEPSTSSSPAETPTAEETTPVPPSEEPSSSEEPSTTAPTLVTPIEAKASTQTDTSTTAARAHSSSTALAFTGTRASAIAGVALFLLLAGAYLTGRLRKEN
ncbi:HtaA domain-containing protein [Arcanobacterium haemolyticum]|nr:HtaA domain-containing protein [Arcanobacterium haemolyticum]